MRLAKYLAHAGVASRRAAEELIAQRRVSVGGQTETDPARDVGEHSEVRVDGELLGGREERVVIVLNKPKGVVSSARDTHGRPTVVDVVGEKGARLYPVGRLDAATTGLILLTNDGELANLLTHPRYEVPKTYRARLAGGPVPDRVLAQLSAGVELDDGPTAPAEVRRIGPAEIEITIREGRNRQVRRMCEATGHRVRELERVAIAGLRLGDLRRGRHRRLSQDEIARLLAGSGT